MPKTPKEISDAFLNRQKELGRKEMRGIRVTPEEESIIKPLVRDKLKKMRKGK